VDDDLIAIAGPIPLTRAEPPELEDEVRALVGSPVVRALLEAVEGGVLVLNAHRQIVAANMSALLGAPDASVEKALGLRLGEALGCVHAHEVPGGCGGSDACRSCGALNVVLRCETTNRVAEGDCAISAENGHPRPYELHLRATPLSVDGRSFTVVAMRDASDEKRRAILEQVFFHDLLNSLTAVSTWSQLLRKVPESRLREAGGRVADLVARLEGEIHSQRALLQAEKGTLELTATAENPNGILGELAASFASHPLTRGRSLDVEPAAFTELQTDRFLLLRVLTNMVTNALEATPEGGRVRLWAERMDGGPRWACAFHVHNATAIPRAVALRLFQRSFSTKARRGRGIGTYSMKLLGERYLGGEVGFTTGEGGTTFTLRLPASLPSDRTASSH